MSEDRSSFRNILKATSLFGGVQIFQIIISIIRGKVVAVLLGPEGVGIVGILTSTSGIIQRATNFGLSISAVRDLAEANETGSQTRVSLVIRVLKRIIWITGALGALTTLILSPWLSKVAFGNQDYTFAFIWISITLLFDQLASGQVIVLQGLRKLKALAKANIIGSSAGLLVGLPLYYWFGINAIVPNIILGSLSSMIISWFYARKISIKQISISCVKAYLVGKKMLVFGFLLNLTAFMGLATDFILRLFISNQGGIEQVGLFTAGFAILNSYIGMIFSAMSTEYYPRLSGVASDKVKCSITINEQIEISIIIMTPIIIAFMLFIHWGLILLYSQKFVPVESMLRWAAVGILIRTAAWAIGYVFMAKGDSKLFISVSIVANIYTLALNLVSYHYFGLTGLGISYTVTGLLLFLVNFAVSNKYYQFRFQTTLIKIFIYLNILVFLTFYLMTFYNLSYKFLWGIICFLVSSLFALYEMNKRVDLKEAVGRFLKRK